MSDRRCCSGQAPRAGQASLEMTVALIGALLLTFAGFQVLFWSARRLVHRHKEYERTRIAAGRMPETATRILWTAPDRINPHRPNEPDPLGVKRLRFFNDD